MNMIKVGNVYLNLDHIISADEMVSEDGQCFIYVFTNGRAEIRFAGEEAETMRNILNAHLTHGYNKVEDGKPPTLRDVTDWYCNLILRNSKSENKAAKTLGISSRSLRNYRQQGRISK